MWNSYPQVVNWRRYKDLSPLKLYRLAPMFLVSRQNLMGKHEDIMHIWPREQRNHIRADQEISSLLEESFHFTK